MRPVVRGYGRPGVRPRVTGFVCGESHRLRLLDSSCADGLPVAIEGDGTPFAETAAVVTELHPHLMIAGRDGLIGGDEVVLDSEEVVAVLQHAMVGIQ